MGLTGLKLCANCDFKNMVRYIRGISKMYTPPFWYGTIIYKEIMGQYYKGTKIGTCENMYYLRLEKARKLAEMGACDDDNIPFLTMATEYYTAKYKLVTQRDLENESLVSQNAKALALALETIKRM